MSCWKCTCGVRNCDTDECTNPACTHTLVVPVLPERCCVCGIMTSGYSLNAEGLKKPFCKHCFEDGTFKHYEKEFTYAADC